MMALIEALEVMSEVASRSGRALHASSGPPGGITSNLAELGTPSANDAPSLDHTGPFQAQIGPTCAKADPQLAERAPHHAESNQTRPGLPNSAWP